MDNVTDVFRGGLAQGQARLDWQVSPHLVAFVQNRFQVAAVFASSTQAIEQVQVYDEVSAGILFTW